MIGVNIVVVRQPITDSAEQRWPIPLDAGATGHDSGIVLHWLRDNARARWHIGGKVRRQVHVVAGHSIDGRFHTAHAVRR